MTSAVYKNILDSGVGEELESVLDQRGICKRKETLGGQQKPVKVYVEGENHSWSFQAKRFESRLK